MSSNAFSDASSWVQEALKDQYLDAFDFLFARSCLASHPHSQEAELFLAVTSALWRGGHPFLIRKPTSIEPTIPYVSGEMLFSLFQHVSEQVLDDIFTFEGDRIYLKQVFQVRKQLFEKLQTLIAASPKFPLECSLDSRLSEEQQHVCKQVMKSCFSIICGGPGTGKTFVATFILREFLKAYPHMHIVVVAPTGKAASHFKAVLSHHKDLDHKVHIKTIHQLLATYRNPYEQEPINVLLIDEGSMVSLDLLHHLVNLLTGERQGDRLYANRMIILGDANQLPPIGIAVGDPLKEMTRLFPSAVHFLTVSQRTKNHQILSLADAILNKQRIPESPSLQPLLSRERMLKLIYEKFVQVLQAKHGPTFCVLTPMRKGAWGVERLNQMLYDRMQRDHAELPIPILSKARCDSFDIVSGEAGIFHPGKHRLYFPGKSPIDARNYTAYEHNYVMSIHKSQGSEYDEVMILIPKGSEVFETSLLYTAVTRAKKELSIWADQEALDKLIRKPYRYEYL